MEDRDDNITREDEALREFALFKGGMGANFRGLG